MIKIYPISTHDQVSDMFTKPLTQNNFVKHRVKVCGSCENISNYFQIYFETNFLLLETLLDRNKLNSSLSCRTQFANKILDK